MGDIRTSDFGGIPYGNNAGRPANPGIGKLYSNGEAQRLEIYTSSGWNNIVQEVPGVSSISGSYNESVGSATITVYGNNFSSGAQVYAIGTNGFEYQATTVTFVSLVQLTVTFGTLSASYEPYDIKVINPSNLFGILPDILYINQTPVWSTSSGSLGSFVENSSMSTSVLAVDPEGTSISYSIASGALPSGLSLNSSTGVISGTPASVTGDTAYNFTISATDGANASSRAFSITVSESGPVWSTGTTLPAFTRNSAYSTTLVATDDSGIAPTYTLQSGTLPTGLSLSSAGVISGTPTSSTNVTITVRATDNHSKFTDRTFSLPNASPTWTTSVVDSGSQNGSYSFSLVATDDSGVAPTYSIASGSLPAGLTLSSAGVISGTITGSTSSFTARATDANGGFTDRSFTLTVEAAWSTVFTGWTGAGTSRSQGAGVIYQDNLILIGGENSSSSSVNTVISLDSSGNKTTLGTIPQNRDEVTAAIIGTNIYVTGGAFNNQGGTSNTMYKYDLTNNTSSTLSAPPYTGYVILNGVLTDGGEAKVYSGSGASTQNTGWYAYSPSGNSYTTKASFPFATYKSSCAYVSYNNIYYMFTSQNTTGTSPAGYERCYKYDPSSNTWTQIASLSTTTGARVNFGGSVAAPDGSGKIYVYGGDGYSAGSSTYISGDTRSYVYDIASNSWSRTSSAWDPPSTNFQAFSVGGKGTTNYYLYDQGTLLKRS